MLKTLSEIKSMKSVNTKNLKRIVENTKRKLLKHKRILTE